MTTITLYQLQFALWLLSGAIGFAFVLIVAYHALHLAAGHRRYHTTYYTPKQYDAIMQSLRDDQVTGRRVLSNYEINHIRKYFLHLKGSLIFNKDEVGMFD